jgi:hypothetical protein
MSSSQARSSFPLIPARSENQLRQLSDNPLPAVIRVFPWNNGITLLQGSMANTLQSLWESQRVGDIGVQNSLLLVSDSSVLPVVPSPYKHAQTQAQVLDSFTLNHLLEQDPRIAGFFQRLATGNRNSFFKNGGWTGLSPQALATIAHVLVRLHIFDSFVDAIAIPPQATLPMLNSIPFPSEFPDRVRAVRIPHFMLDFSLHFVFQVLDPLKVWTRPINELKRIVDIALKSSKKKVKSIEQPKSIEEPSNMTDIVLPNNPTPSAVAALNDIESMLRVFRLATTGKLLNILTYTELLGLSVSWFSKVRSPCCSVQRTS